MFNEVPEAFLVTANATRTKDLRGVFLFDVEHVTIDENEDDYIADKDENVDGHIEKDDKMSPRHLCQIITMVRILRTKMPMKIRRMMLKTMRMMRENLHECCSLVHFHEYTEELPLNWNHQDHDDHDQ